MQQNGYWDYDLAERRGADWGGHKGGASPEQREARGRAKERT
jgi:hypothetical protein